VGVNLVGRKSTYLSNVSEPMEVVGRSSACVKVRALITVAGVVAAAGVVLAPVGAAPGEQPAYRRLVELESTRSFSDELTAMLASGDVKVAGRAALALGRTQDPRAAGLLKNATGAQDVSLRASAVYGYGLLAAKNPIDGTLVAKVLDDTAPAVRVAAVDAAWRAMAAKLPDAEALGGRLLALEDSDPDPIVRARAATALSAWKDAANPAGFADAIQKALVKERDRGVRWHEAWTLRRAFATLTAPATIRAGLADVDELVRIQFADLVGRRKAKEGVRQLQPLLRDRSWRVREQTYESITLLRGGKRTEHLTAVPAGIVTPVPAARNTETPLQRPTGLGPPGKPLAADARLDLPLQPATSALMNGPMPGPHPRVRIGTTKGTLVVRLYPEWAPLTVANFLGLVDRGYYDGLRWFRIVPDFVVQTGDPHDNGEGDAGYTIPAEENPLEQRAGVISMGLNYTDPPDAHAIRDSAGTQFYITLSPQLHLNRDFTVFGEVESGFATLGRLVEKDRMTRVERLADD
jgi:peptidyl-prolyl cis-trans isomerase B (cyclophilin B)